MKNTTKTMNDVLEQLRTEGAMNADLYRKIKKALETDSQVSGELSDPQDRKGICVDSMRQLLSLASGRVRAGLLAMATAPAPPPLAGLTRPDASLMTADAINVVAQQTIQEAVAAVQAFRNGGRVHATLSADADVVDVEAFEVPSRQSGPAHV